MKRIILCADDYGQTPSISQAIIELIKTQRLSAVSCMVTASCWPLHASWLEPYINQMDIGLHFNLTHGDNCSSLSTLIFQSYAGLLKKNKLRDALIRQIDAFSNEMKMLPNFIDGHQHVHQLPSVRDILLEVFEDRFKDADSYLRSTYSANAWWNVNSHTYIKNIILQLLGGKAFARQLITRHIAHNMTFSGLRSFDNKIDYQSLFVSFLKEIKDGGLIMCHPGFGPTSEDDSIGNIRVAEYQFFSSENMLKCLEKSEVKLTRFRDLFRSDQVR